MRTGRDVVAYMSNLELHNFELLDPACICLTCAPASPLELLVDRNCPVHATWLPDRVLRWLDGVALGLHVPASFPTSPVSLCTTDDVAAALSETWDDAEAAIYALVEANLVGEEPPGYFYTDQRDPAFRERQSAVVRELAPAQYAEPDERFG